MNIKRFFGKNSREALGMVRKALGDDAVILSNRSVNGGNEIMAFKEEDINALIADEMEVADKLAEESDSAQNDDEATVAASESLAPASDLESFNPTEKPDYLRADMTKTGQQPAAPELVPDMQAAAPNMASHASSPINEAFKQLDAPQYMSQATPQEAPLQQMAPQPVAPQPAPMQAQLADQLQVQQATSQTRPEAQAPLQKQPQQYQAEHQAQAPNLYESEMQNKAQLSAMLKEMNGMRTDIESQLDTFKQTELKPLERLPSSAQKQAEQKQAAPQNPQMMEMLTEMRNMRSAFESKLTSLNWDNISKRNPVQSDMLSLLLSAGFSASLSRQMAENIPRVINGHGITPELAKKWMENILQLNINTIEHENTLFDEGGVFALVGPTGVGKTTTTAKLAARYVMKHGTENLGIITTDAYRVGGHEQLRIYGKILGVMVHAVKDETDLKIALNELKNKHTILIDTVGVSQKDRMVAEQISMLSNTQRPIKKLLCVNATNTGATLTDVVRAYQGKNIDGCILTKIDEAATIGNALDVVIRNKLKVYYATNGQRVPEDIIHADKEKLVKQAFERDEASQAPFEFLEEELPFVMSNMAGEESEAGVLAHV